jgi:hypothetical protein
MIPTIQPKTRKAGDQMQKAEDGEIISLNNCIQNYSATM